MIHLKIWCNLVGVLLVGQPLGIEAMLSMDEWWSWWVGGGHGWQRYMTNYIMFHSRSSPIIMNSEEIIRKLEIFIKNKHKS